MRVAVHLSEFLARLAYLETSGIARTHWEPSDVPIATIKAPDSYIDTSLPLTSRPFQYARHLSSLITHGDCDDLSYFMLKLGYLPGNTLSPPRGEWRGWISNVADECGTKLAVSCPYLQNGNKLTERRSHLLLQPLFTRRQTARWRPMKTPQYWTKSRSRCLL